MRQFYRLPYYRGSSFFSLPPCSQQPLWALEITVEIRVPRCPSGPGPCCRCWGFLAAWMAKRAKMPGSEVGTRLSKRVVIFDPREKRVADGQGALPPLARSLSPEPCHGAQASPGSGSKNEKLTNHDSNRNHLLGKEKTRVKSPPALEGKRFCALQERAIRLAGTHILLAEAVPLCINN